jgi:hypothetical protein
MTRSDLSRRRLALRLGALLALAAGPMAAATFRVGSEGPPCTHATLAAAVAAAAANGPASDTILLSDNITLSAPIDIDNQSLEIAGGFSDCSDEDAGQARSGITAQVADTCGVHGVTTLRVVNLLGLLVIRPGAAPAGRLLRIESPAIVFLGNTLLSGGAAVDGGNVWMSGPQALLSITEWAGAGSSVYSGDATGFGGGVYCQGGGAITIDRGSISGNHADLDGGGAYLNDCRLNVFDGQVSSLACPTGTARGLLCNSAGRVGGGIFATGGSTVTLEGSAAAPALVAENDADEGGGIYATGAGTTVTGHDVWFLDNTAPFEGGGVYVRDGATFTLDSTEPDCRYSTPCSRFAGNAAAISGGVGGAIAADSGADVTVRQTGFTGNHANTRGSVVFAEDAGTQVHLEGVVTWANAGSLNRAYLDTDDQALLRVGFSTFDEDMGCCKGIFDTNNGSDVEVFSSVLMAILESTGEGKVFDDAPGAGEGRIADCVLFQENPASLPPPIDPGAQEALSGAATHFSNREAGDFRLRRGTQAVDFCDTFRYTPAASDVDLEARGFDDPAVADSPFGAFDLGADEWRPILLADHEEGTCVDWTTDTGGC